MLLFCNKLEDWVFTGAPSLGVGAVISDILSMLQYPHITLSHDPGGRHRHFISVLEEAVKNLSENLLSVNILCKNRHYTKNSL